MCDSELIVSDPEKSLADGAVTPWAKAAKRLQKLYAGTLASLARAYGVSVETPWKDLPEKFRQVVLFGTGGRAVEMNFGDAKSVVTKPFDGVVAQLRHLYETTESELSRQRIRQYMSRRTCSACGGARLKPEILAVRVNGGAHGELNIRQFSQLPIGEALDFMRGLTVSDQERFITTEVRREIEARLSFLVEVGLGYLSLDRESGTLCTSATTIGSSGRSGACAIWETR
jgi:excinuclease ABC subunit A